VRVELAGTGGPDGWPSPGCGCASCRRAVGQPRRPFSALVDGVVRLASGERPAARAGYLITSIEGGWDIAGPSGRLLCAGGPGSVPDPPPGTGRFDVALLDLLAYPPQLGLLRRRGLVTGETVVAPIYAGHQISSAAELTRRCLLWGVCPAQDGDTLVAPQRASTVEPSPRVLVLGGARSGKSTEAEMRLAGEPFVSYIATDPGREAGGGGDPAWAARVAAHRARRPAWWRTVETMAVTGVLTRERGAVLIDSVSGWLAGTMEACGCWDRGPNQRLEQSIDELAGAWRASAGRVVAVSDETGLGVVPPTRAGGLFRDQLGQLNQRLAAESDETVLVVAGRVIGLP